MSTVSEATEKRLKMRNGTSTANQMSTPPMVGVPSLVLWPSGPSSRMFWPNSLRRSQRMNGGPMTSIRTMASTLAPMALSIGRPPLRCAGAAPRRRAPGAAAREALTSTALPAGTTSGSAARHSSTVANQRSPGGAGEVVAGELADGHQAHAGGGAVLADGAVEGVGAGAELVHVAEDGHRRAAVGDARRGGRRRPSWPRGLAL